ncbi:MAG: hypothetical protein LBU04_07785 [Christensenellaceae bacterium]|nr:hypothetical protein [Christensenellaceae bacterium]
MKKILEKIVSITLAFIALLFVILMLVVMFKPEYAENMNNALVHVLMIIFAGIFGVLTAINIISAFSDAERINNILLFKGKDSATKASISVVKKIAKVSTAQIEGAKLRKATLYVDENNDVKMKVDLKINDSDVEKIISSVRANLITTFDEVLGFRFKSIDFSVINLKNETYTPDPDRIKIEKEKFSREQAIIKANEEAKRLREEADELAEEADSETILGKQSDVKNIILESSSNEPKEIECSDEVVTEIDTENITTVEEITKDDLIDDTANTAEEKPDDVKTLEDVEAVEEVANEIDIVTPVDEITTPTEEAAELVDESTIITESTSTVDDAPIDTTVNDLVVSPKPKTANPANRNNNNKKTNKGHK